MSIAEPDVALTDYAITLECALLAWLLARTPGTVSRLREWFIVFFAAVALAALLGGTEHGFLSGDATLLRALVWKGTLVAIGASALAAWMVGAELIAPPAGRWVRVVALMLFVGYVLAVARSDAFVIAIAHYLPAVVFLLMVFIWRYLRTRVRHYVWGAVGLLLTLVAAGVQQARIGLDPVLFDHNALYHLIQAVGLLALFMAGRGIVHADT